jgi:hypothetical protein
MGLTGLAMSSQQTTGHSVEIEFSGSAGWLRRRLAMRKGPFGAWIPMTPDYMMQHSKYNFSPWACLLHRTRVESWNI